MSGYRIYREGRVLPPGIIYSEHEMSRLWQPGDRVVHLDYGSNEVSPVEELEKVIEYAEAYLDRLRAVSAAERLRGSS